MSAPKPVPFSDFYKSLAVVKTADLLKHKFARVKSEDHAEEMRRHLIAYYQAVSPTHSFVDKFKQTWDCIPVNQQPSLKGSGTGPARPPQKVVESKTRRSSDSLLVPPPFNRKGNRGNAALSCPEGSIPLRRITPEEIAGFETLEDYFRKTPKAGGRHKKLMVTAGAPVVHKYANAYQAVPNVGGHSLMTICKPKISGNEIFSLCQHWYTSANTPPLQTVEAGWQVFPQKYGTDYPALFVYWTADDYTATGAYNLDKPGFVQTSPHWGLGGALPYYSLPGGKQYELELAWFFDQGNWWLYLNGLNPENIVGYYPAALYNGGPLSGGAKDIDYGGEVVGSVSWPQMGSGEFAAAGNGNAARQASISYFDPNGNSQWADLAGQQDTPACYTIDVGFNDEAGTYFYYGGPGGAGC